MITVSLDGKMQAECPSCRAVLDFDATTLDEEIHEIHGDALPADYNPDDALVKTLWSWTRRGLRSIYFGTLALVLAGLAGAALWLSGSEGELNRWSGAVGVAISVLFFAGSLSCLFGSCACGAVPSATGAKVFAIASAFGFLVGLVCLCATAIERAAPWATVATKVSFLIAGVAFASFLARLGEFLRYVELERSGRCFAIFLVGSMLLVLALEILSRTVGGDPLRIADAIIGYALLLVGVVLGVRLVARAESVIRDSRGRPAPRRLLRGDLVAVRSN